MDVVEYFGVHTTFQSDLITQFKEIGDLERLISKKVAAEKINPSSELVKLNVPLNLIESIKEEISKCDNHSFQK